MKPRVFGRRAFLAHLPPASIVAAGGVPLLVASCGEASDRKTYVAGSTTTGVPFSFLDPASNELTGAMVDVVKAVFADAKLQLEVQVVAFAALIPSLTAAKIDLIAAAMAKTDERAKVVDFSTPVLSYGAGVVVPAADAKQYATIADLNGMTVGAQVGTRFVRQLEEAGATVKTYDGLSDVLRDLDNGRLQAGYGDQPIFAYRLGQTKSASLKLATGFTPPSREEVCLITAKGSALLPQLNRSIETLRATRIAEILAKWGIS